MLRRLSASIIAVTLIVSVLCPTLAFAAGMVPIVPSDCNTANGGVGGCQSVCDIVSLAQNILTDALYIGVFLAAILFAYAGFQMLINPINSSARSKAKSLLTNVIIGFIIILGSWILVNEIMSFLVTGAGTVPWNKIC